MTWAKCSEHGWRDVVATLDQSDLRPQRPGMVPVALDCGCEASMAKTAMPPDEYPPRGWDL